METPPRNLSGVSFNLELTMNQRAITFGRHDYDLSQADLNGEPLTAVEEISRAIGIVKA
jgi:hypothetical protein